MQSKTPKDFESKAAKDKKAVQDPIDSSIYAAGQDIITRFQKGAWLDEQLGAFLFKTLKGNKREVKLLYDRLYDLIDSLEKYDRGRYEDIRSKSYPKVRKPFIQAIELINASNLPEDIRLGIINSVFLANLSHYRLLAKPLESRDAEMTEFLLKNGANPFQRLINFDSAFHLLSKTSDGAHSIEENAKCIDLVIQYSMNFINDDNVDVFINAIKEAITPKKSAEAKIDSSFEFSTALAKSIEMKRIPVRYLVKLFQSIHVEEHPALWPALKEIESAVIPRREIIIQETKMPPVLATLITDYLSGEVKTPAASDIKNRALVNHVYRATINFLNHEWAISFNDDKRLSQLKKIFEKHKDLKGILFDSSLKESKSEVDVNAELLNNIKALVEDAKGFMLGRAAHVPGIFHYFSRDANEWHHFEEQNKFVFKEFDNLLNQLNLAPEPPAH